MTLIRKGIEQIRREGLANAQAKIKQQEDYQAKVDSMSKHSVGGLYDVRTIIKFSGATERPLLRVSVVPTHYPKK